MTCIGDNIDLWSIVLCLIFLALALALASKLASSVRINLRSPIIACVVIDVVIGVLVRSYIPCLTRDEVTWHALATAAAQAMGGVGASASYVAGKEGYMWIVGFFYWLAAPAPIIPLVLNLSAHVVTASAVGVSAALLVRDARPTMVRAAGAWGAWLIALNPIIFWWAAYVLRESLTMMAVSLSACAAIWGARKGRSLTLLWALPPLALLYWIRGGLGIGTAAALVIGFIFARLGRSRWRTWLTVLLGLGLVILAFRGWGMISDALGVSEDRVASGTAELSTIASSGFGGLSSSNSLFSVLTVTFPRVLLGPFPWELSASGVMALAVLDQLCWMLALLPVAARVIQRRPLPGGSWVALVLFGFHLGALALSVGNYGLLARFRPMMTVDLMPMAAVILAAWRDRRHQRRRTS